MVDGMMAQVSYSIDEDALFKSAFEHSAIGMALVGLDGCWLKVNPAICRIVGYEKEDLLASNFQAITHPEDVDSDMGLMKQLANDEISFFNLEKRYFHRNGHIVWVLLTVSLIRNLDSTPRFVISQIQDISARIKAEAEYKALLLENRMLMQNLFEVQEQERRYLARELHDELGQWLTAIDAEARTIARRAARQPEFQFYAETISNNIKEMHEVIHGMLRQLRPALLDMLGLADSVRDLQKQWCMHQPDTLCELSLQGDLENLGEVINITVYRIIQEALSNVRSHAQATRVRVRLSREENAAPVADTLLLSVEDNGRGHDPALRSEGLGLLGMRERSIAAGGTFSWNSAPLQGTRIEVRLPVGFRREPA
jgi:two-component system nitrate/nitrite sensor histidine kinase NarX/two-component system sensor histidine kinase UhpB